MASRRFFVYDPFDYYYTAAAPYNYPYNPYYQRQPAASRRSRGAEPVSPRARDTTKTSFEIPVHGPDSDPQPQPQPQRKAMSAEDAALRMQAAARGLLSRKSVRAVREVQREAEQVHAKMAAEAEALVAHPSACVAIGEALMRLLLRLDGVRGARVYRGRITKRLLALQDAIDELVTTPASVVATELPDSAERGGEMESIMKTVVHTTPPAQVEIDETTAAAGEAEAGEGEEEEKEAVPGDANEPEDSDAEAEWEMVTEEENERTAAPLTDTSEDQEPPRPLETPRTATAACNDDGVDARKVMQMVAALCEQSTQQCAVMGALAERVDALERAVRRMEDAESRRP